MGQVGAPKELDLRVHLWELWQKEHDHLPIQEDRESSVYLSARERGASKDAERVLSLKCLKHQGTATWFSCPGDVKM